MKVGVIQSSYVPWRGYFDFIRSVDLFVIYDDVQYSKGSWRNRNQVKLPTGLQWLTVPVSISLGQNIDQVKIARGRSSWVDAHAALLRRSLSDAPHFDAAWQLWSDAVAHSDEMLSALNVRLLKSICEYLGIRTPIALSTQFTTRGSSTERLISLLEAAGATAYLSGPSAAAYLDTRMFADRNIELLYKAYDYRPYPQLHGEFVGTVTVLDLIANCGPRSSQHLGASCADRLVVP